MADGLELSGNDADSLLVQIRRRIAAVTVGVSRSAELHPDVARVRRVCRTRLKRGGCGIESSQAGDKGERGGERGRKREEEGGRGRGRGSGRAGDGVTLVRGSLPYLSPVYLYHRRGSTLVVGHQMYLSEPSLVARSSNISPHAVRHPPGLLRHRTG